MLEGKGLAAIAGRSSRSSPPGASWLRRRAEDLPLAVGDGDPDDARSGRLSIVNQAEVPQLLPMTECIEVMARAFAALARGEATLPLRQIVWLPEQVGALGLMPRAPRRSSARSA